MTIPLQELVPLAPWTTLHVGGPARYFVEASSEAIVIEAAQFAAAQDLPLLVLGGGSNLLVADAGFPGLVLHIGIGGTAWNEDGAHVRLTAGAGENWDGVVAESVGRKLAGLECLSGIPGSAGGTPVQNVGAYGQEVAETIFNVRTYDRESGRIVEFDNRACGFGYRSSLFNTIARGRYIVLSVSFRLTKDGPPALRYPELQKELADVKLPSLSEVREAVQRIRSRKAMLLKPGDPDSRSAGSFFKNPILSVEDFDRLEATAGEPVPHYPAPEGNIKTAAAWLIEHAGFRKGYSRGTVGISSKHTLALINKGGATAADIVRLATEIRQGVQQRFGVTLISEPVFAGDFAEPISETDQ